jgi:hypothetical protein
MRSSLFAEPHILAASVVALVVQETSTTGTTGRPHRRLELVRTPSPAVDPVFESRGSQGPRPGGASSSSMPGMPRTLSRPSLARPRSPDREGSGGPSRARAKHPPQGAPGGRHTCRPPPGRVCTGSRLPTPGAGTEPSPDGRSRSPLETRRTAPSWPRQCSRDHQPGGAFLLPRWPSRGAPRPGGRCLGSLDFLIDHGSGDHGSGTWWLPTRNHARCRDRTPRLSPPSSQP